MPFIYTTNSPSYTFRSDLSSKGFDPNQPYWINSLASDWKLELASFGAAPAHRIGISFPTTLPSSFPFNEYSTIKTFSSEDRAKTWALLHKIETLIDVRFFDSTDPTADNNVSFFQTDLPSGILGLGYVIYPNNFPGAAVMNSAIDIAHEPIAGYALLHEIGHTLGLKHPFDGIIRLKEQEDNHTATVESYSGLGYVSENPSASYIDDFASLDVAALQYLYGPSKSARTGDDTYKPSETKTNFIWDGGGIDTIDASAASTGATIYLTPSEWGFFGKSAATFITAPGQITVNPLSAIENAIGSAHDDFLHGNGFDNTLSGGNGNDKLTGHAGNDILDGGRGIDTAVFNGPRANYAIQRSTAGIAVTDSIGTDGNDALTSIERLEFSDNNLAFDLQGDAGHAAKVIGAVFGGDAIKNTAIAGVGIGLIDAGITAEGLAEAALAYVLGTSLNSHSAVSLLYKNIVGVTASAQDIAGLSETIDAGFYSIGGFAAAAANLDINLVNIDFVGLSHAGLSYLPQPVF